MACNFPGSKKMSYLLPTIKQSKSIRVCYFGTYRSEYSRNRIMIEGLRRAGTEVVECHSKLWIDIEDRVNIASGGWKSFKFIYRLIVAYMILIRKIFTIGDFDVMVVGYPGQLDIFIAKLICIIRHKPLCWDINVNLSGCLRTKPGQKKLVHCSINP